ncbi:site-2 protease family protein, partial [Candidatus Microgenomates bacterium]|nr:site-2 protease family protein [Candidatus Microgenomates bacterium]
IAGPISNLVLASICAILARILPLGFLPFFSVLIAINVRLALFNLIPIHPLDGFKIVGGLLPREKAHEWYQLERYGLIFLLFLIIPFGPRSMLESILGPFISVVTTFLIPHAAAGGVI